MGYVWALIELWESLGFERLRNLFRRTRYEIDVVALILLVVLNRLCDPDSKLDVLRWTETIALPDMPLRALTNQHLFRRLPQRIRAHAMICFMALILQHVMRQRFREANTVILPECAMQTHKRIQHH